MKLSYNWLKDFVDIEDIRLEELADRLTMSAFEVEEIEATREAIDSKVVLGKIEEIRPHENADKLQVTKTSIGSETFQIVCGAKNIKEGQLVPVALVGAWVTDRKTGNKFQIKDSKIRGVESFGMLCSAEELGFSEDEVNAITEKQGDGIYIMNSDAALGTSIEEVLGLEKDYVLEVGARSNRGDALSVMGQARELAAILKKTLKKPQEPKLEHKPGLTTIEPKVDSDCDLFYTVAIKNIEIKESPAWLKNRINAMGIKSINNIVDISNYVLLERGQPMHFYDMNKLTGNTLSVRRAKAGERIFTLEEKEHNLTDINLVIADEAKPVCLAGVMGGMECSINDKTTDILIELAVFSPSVVRKSSRAAGVESESKRRYERGVDKGQSHSALLKAISLILELAGTDKTELGEIKTAGSDKTDKMTVTLRFSELEKILGISIPEKEITELLANLDITKESSNKEAIEFSIPSFRQNDVTREIDLIEEIGRLYGFDQIPEQAAPAALFTSTKDVLNFTQSQEEIRKAFQSYGFSEVKLSSLVGKAVSKLDEEAKNLLQADNFEIIAMDNPLSQEHSYLRRSLIPGLVQAASRNYAYDKNKDIKLFEIGKVYGNTGECQEINRLGAILIKTETNWLNKKEATLAENFYSFKSVIEELFQAASFSSTQSSGQQLIHPGISAEVKYQGKNIGLLAKLHPSVQKEWDLPGEAYVVELDLPRSKNVKFKAITNTPAILRDITVDSKLGLESQDLINFIKKTSPKTLKEIKVSSLYIREQGNLELENNKSTTLSMLWQDDKDTLKGDEIDSNIEKLKGLLEKELSVTFRG